MSYRTCHVFIDDFTRFINGHCGKTHDSETGSAGEKEVVVAATGDLLTGRERED